MDQKGVLKKFEFAQRSLVLQQADFSLSVLSQMVEGKVIDTDPRYQRRARWKPNKQSALIESFLLNVPVPPIYLSEDEYGTYSVIDGKQRLTAISEFMNGNLKLKNLKEFPELEGYVYDQLPSKMQNALSIRPYIRAITLLKQSDEELKYEVFLRLNTGGEILKAQEIRNVAYSGNFNDLLYSLSENSFFKKQMKIISIKSTPYKNMDDLEHVLRFFAISVNWNAMTSILSKAMDDYMHEHRHLDSIGEFEEKFLRSINGCERIWGDSAFHKPIEGGWRDQFISPLYDAEMAAVSLLTDSELRNAISSRENILQATKLLFAENQSFVKSVSQSTNNSSSVRRRVRDMYLLLKAC